MKTRETGICVATRYRSVAELVERMHPYCDERSLFVATQQTRAMGTRVKFALQLADRTTALCGWCEVVEAWSTADNRFHRPGVQLALRRLTPESQLVFDRLLERAQHRRSDDAGERTQVKARRARATTMKLLTPAAVMRSWPRRPTGPTRPNRTAAPPREPTTDRLAALAPDGALHARDPSDRLILPANPLSGLSDASIGRMVDRHVGGDALALPLPAPPDASGPARALDATLAVLLADPAARALVAPEPRAPHATAIGTRDLAPYAADAVRAADALAALDATGHALDPAAAGRSRVRWDVVALSALIVLAIAAALGLGFGGLR